MLQRRSRFVLLCQQAFAFAVVGTVAASAAGVVELKIVTPEETSVRTLTPDPTSPVSEAPVRPTVRNVPLDTQETTTPRSPAKSRTGAPVAQRIEVTSPATRSKGYATVGVTWSAEEELDTDDITVSVRTRDRGRWTSWQEMHYDADHGPDPGTQEAFEQRTVKAGTDAVVVGDVDDVQVRTVTRTGSAPEDLSLAIVNPGDSVTAEQEPSIDTATLSSSTTASSAVLSADMAVSPKPKIFSRAQWGADESLRDKPSLHYGEIHAGFVHHTVNANAYSRADVPAILRGIYAYHTRSRGWSDIGYNFLVDRFGQIWEGRYGGVDRPVVGAHTLGYNDDAFAMSAIGNFDTARPSDDMVRAYGKLFAWKLSLHGINAASTRQYVGSRYFAAINGHRDAGSTACPGRFLYARIADIRTAARRIQVDAADPAPTPEPTPTPTTPPAPPAKRVLTADLSGGDWPDLIVRDKATRRAVIVRTGGQLAFLDPEPVHTGWDGKDLVASPGDLDGDGKADLLARSASTGITTLYPGAGDGTVGPASIKYTRFSGLDQLTGVGDFDGDGSNDLVGRVAASGRLLLYTGRGDGHVDRPVELSSRWSRYDLTQGVNDLDGDGARDLVARAEDVLYLVRGNGKGRLLPRVALPGSWSGFDVLAGRGDATGDGVPDLVARVRSTGTTYLYPGDGAGGLGLRVGGWQQYAGLRWLGLGRMDDRPRPDLVGLTADDGELLLSSNNGRTNLGRVIDTGTVLDGIDLLLNVGDWNDDGHGDVMTRVAATGQLQLRKGNGGGTLAAPVVVREDWSDKSLVAAVGDMSGDGLPDLVARGRAGRDRVFPSDGRNGFGTGFVTTAPQRATGRVGLSLWTSDNVPDTALRRGDGTLWLWETGGDEAVQVGSRLRRYDWLLGLGDVDGDGRADLVARTRDSGDLWLLPGSASGFTERRLIAPGFDRYDRAG